MPPLIDLTGKVFGAWEVLGRSDANRKSKGAMWKCRCNLCGRVYDVSSNSLRRGDTTKCRSCSAKLSQVHPYAKDPIKVVFMGMKQRCYNKNHVAYDRYGGRGIKVCEEWLEDPVKFYGWAYANGYGDGMSIERVDYDGDYCPENCKFIPLSDQSKNRSGNHMVTIHGETLCLTEWCELLHIPYESVKGRVLKGWDEKDAMLECIRLGYTGYGVVVEGAPDSRNRTP